MGKIYTYEFSILNNPYFLEKDYVLVTTSPDEEGMESFVNLFYTHNQGIYCCKNAFIIPQFVFDNVLKSLLDTSTKEIIVHDWEGGEN